MRRKDMQEGSTEEISYQIKKLQQQPTIQMESLQRQLMQRITVQPLHMTIVGD